MNVEFIKDFAGAIEIMKNVEPFYDSKSRLVTNAWRRENLNMEFMGEHYGFQESDFYVCKIDGKPIGAFVAYDAARTSDLYKEVLPDYDWRGGIFLNRLCIIEAGHKFDTIRTIMDAFKDMARAQGYTKIVGDAGAHQPILTRFYEMLGAQRAASFMGTLDAHEWIVYEYKIE